MIQTVEPNDVDEVYGTLYVGDLKYAEDGATVSYICGEEGSQKGLCCCIEGEESNDCAWTNGVCKATAQEITFL